MCFAEFLSYYRKSIKDIECDCQPVVLDIELMENVKCSYPKWIPLIPSKEKLKCRNVKADLRCRQPSPNRNIGKLANHILFSFYPFRIEEYLMLPSITGNYFEKLQESGDLDEINRNRAMM